MIGKVAFGVSRLGGGCTGFVGVNIAWTPRWFKEMGDCWSQRPHPPHPPPFKGPKCLRGVGVKDCTWATPMHPPLRAEETQRAKADMTPVKADIGPRSCSGTQHAKPCAPLFMTTAIPPDRDASCSCLMYWGCEWVCATQDAQLRPDVLGTLLFILPIKGTDVQVALRSGSSADFSISTPAEDCQWVAFYSGVRCSLRSDYDGYHLVLRYTLVRQGYRSLTVQPGPAARALFAAISETLHTKHRKKKKQNGVSFRLQFAYPPGPVMAKHLKGEDAQFYHIAAQQPDFDVRLRFIIRDREDPEDDGVAHFLVLSLKGQSGSPVRGQEDEGSGPERGSVSPESPRPGPKSPLSPLRSLVHWHRPTSEPSALFQPLGSDALTRKACALAATESAAPVTPSPPRTLSWAGALGGSGARTGRYVSSNGNREPEPCRHQ